MSIIVYWLEPHLGANSQSFEMAAMDEAITFVYAKRTAGFRHVSMSVENPNMIGKVGVDSVENGKLPSGEGYGWMKRRKS